MSNFNGIVNNYITATEQFDLLMSMEKIQAKLRKYLKKPDNYDTKNSVHIMVVITAALEHAGGERTSVTRYNSLQGVPHAMADQMRTFFGDNIQIHLTHFYDSILEYTAYDGIADPNTYYREIAALSNPVDAPGGLVDYLDQYGTNTINKNHVSFGESYVFDVSKPDGDYFINPSNPSADKKNLAGVLRDMDALFMVGGETHWLNTQMKKMKLKTILDTMTQDRRFVFGGYSAGIINTGKVTTLAAAKRTIEGRGDFIGNVSDEHGNKMKDDFYVSDYAHKPVPYVPPLSGQVELRDHTEKNFTYAGLNRAHELVFFPHYNYSPWESEVIAPCMDPRNSKYPKFGEKIKNTILDGVGLEQVVRMTDRMLIFFHEYKAHYVFQDSKLQAYVKLVNTLTGMGYPESRAVFEIFEALQNTVIGNMNPIHCTDMASFYAMLRAAVSFNDSSVTVSVTMATDEIQDSNGYYDGDFKTAMTRLNTGIQHVAQQQQPQPQPPPNVGGGKRPPTPIIWNGTGQESGRSSSARRTLPPRYERPKSVKPPLASGSDRDTTNVIAICGLMLVTVVASFLR